MALLTTDPTLRSKACFWSSASIVEAHHEGGGYRACVMTVLRAAAGKRLGGRTNCSGLGVAFESMELRQGECLGQKYT